MKIKNIFFKDRVFLYAILISIAWHLFWLSMFDVTVVPKIKKQVRFSTVAFLGPILDRGMLTLSVEQHERTAAEKRFLASLETSPLRLKEATAEDLYRSAVPENEVILADDEVFVALTISALDTQKIGPGRDVD